MKYLIFGSGGPGFESREEAVAILKEFILPSLDQLIKLEKEKKIVAGGIPVGDRAFTFIVEASSHEEVDTLLRGLPAWGVLEWEVTALQTFSGRAEEERNVIRNFKK